MVCTFQATIDGKFAPLIGLKNDDMDIDIMITTSTKGRKRPWITKGVVDLSDERSDLKTRWCESEGATEILTICD